MAFARPVEQKKQRTFVARMSKLREVIQQLVGAAYARVALPSADQGLGLNSQIFALADGAKGLKEALENSFPNLQFIARSAPTAALRGQASPGAARSSSS